jgi:hypothetical protein
MPIEAQSTFPTKPVRILVGANAGGGNDIIARLLAEKFSDTFKQQILLNSYVRERRIFSFLCSSSVLESGTPAINHAT